MERSAGPKEVTFNTEGQGVSDGEKVCARARKKGTLNIISAKDPTLWQIYKWDAAIDVVKSAPQKIDRVPPSPNPAPCS